MYSLDVIQVSISRMDDDELMERWEKEMFSDEAKPLVEKELRRRGIDPNNYVTHVSAISTEVTPRKPILIPVLFAVISGGTTGGKFGGAIAGATGAGIGAMFFAVVGWYLGRLVVDFARRWKSPGIRFFIYCATIMIWFFLNAVATALSLWGQN